MLNFNEQQKRYDDQWNKFSKNFESNLHVDDPLAIYVIGIHLHQDLHEDMQRVSGFLKSLHTPVDPKKDQWLKPHQMHITLELPGRIGKHFQEDEIPFIKDTVEKITKNTPKFNIQLGNLNCFPSVIIREIYDKNNNIFKLHNEIAKAIPYSEHPEYRYENFIPHMSIVYLGGGSHSKIFNHPNFNRTLDFQDMKVEKLYFLKASDTDYLYKEDIITEFQLQ